MIEGLLTIVAIFLISLYIGRISPNGFRRDFPLALLLFSQVYIFLKLFAGIGYSIFVGLSLILGFWGVNIAYDSITNQRTKENLTRLSDSSWSSIAYALYSLLVLTRIIGSINLVHKNMEDIVLLVSIYSLLLPLFASLFHSRFQNRGFVLNFFLLSLYYGIIGYTIGYLSEWSLIETMFSVALYVGVLLHFWATLLIKRENHIGVMSHESPLK